MADESWLPMKSQPIFREGIDLYLSNWSVFQECLDQFIQGDIKGELAFFIFSYFTTAAEPDVNGLTERLDSLFVEFTTWNRTSEELVAVYHQSIEEVTGDLNYHKLDKAIDLVLSDWAEFQNLLNKYKRIKKEEVRTDIFTFFATTTDPDVDGLANMLKRCLSTRFNLGYDVRMCKKAAHELWNMYQGCLKQRYKSIQVLRENKQPGQPLSKPTVKVSKKRGVKVRR